MEFYDLNSRVKSSSIDLLFPNWENGKENVVFLSPHDDDVILGAGYVLEACLKNHANIKIIIFNDGSAGYSDPSLKNEIFSIRKQETIEAFNVFGIGDEDIVRFEIPDFSGIHYLGWKLPWSESEEKAEEGVFSRMISILRGFKTTRLLFPNGYREHVDHTAVYLSAIFDGPQVGDTVLIDRGSPSKIKDFMQYSVWSKFSPSDSLIHRRKSDIRANRAIVAEETTEQKIIESLKHFKSQEQIISYILDVRKERKLAEMTKYIELYLQMDPRPRFDYDPYKRLILDIDG